MNLTAHQSEQLQLATSGIRFIREYEGYAVSHNGIVFSMWSNSGIKLNYGTEIKPDVMPSGHLRARLRVARLRYRHTWVHHLVLLAFHGPRKRGMICRHLDGNPANNSVENLAWGTHRENEEDKKRHGTHQTGEGNPSAKLTDDDVRFIRKVKDERGCEYGLNPALAEMFGVSVTVIKNVARRKTWGHVD